MEADAGFDLRLLHLVGVGEGKRTNEVDTVAQHGKLASGHGTVAIDVSHDIAYLDFLVFSLVDISIHMTDGQFATQFATHEGCSRLGEVEAEISRAGYLANVRHIHSLAEFKGVGFDSTEDVFVVFVEGKAEVDGTRHGLQLAGKLLALPKHLEVALIADASEGFELFHHEFPFQGELIDDTLGLHAGGGHVGNAELHLQLVFVLESGDVAHSLYRQPLAVSTYPNVAEVDVVIIATHGGLEVDGYTELTQCKGKGLGNVFQQGASLDERRLIAELASCLLAG